MKNVKNNLFEIAPVSDGNLSIHLLDRGRDCDFLTFLIKASNFSWRKEAEGVTDFPRTERVANTQHLIAKLCAIGYMFLPVKTRDTARAVVAYDTDHACGGRTGKSLFGRLFTDLLPSVLIDGRFAFENDRFLWQNINSDTRCVLIDDVPLSFDLRVFFSEITDDWLINKKGEHSYKIPFKESPKIYITSSRALKGEGASYRRRQWALAFSDYWQHHDTLDAFGRALFDEWGAEQWALTYELIAACIQTYLTFGIIESPEVEIEQPNGME